MRPVFVIYVAAGLTLLFAVLNTVGGVGNAYMTQHAITALSPTGDELERIREVRSQHLGSAAESFALALLQGAIIIYGRKLNRKLKAAQPVAAAVADEPPR